MRFEYACRSCEGASHEEPAALTTPVPVRPIPKSNASPALAAFITVSKFTDGLPLYGQESILARYPFALPRTTMANWMIKLGELVLYQFPG